MQQHPTPSRMSPEMAALWADMIQARRQRNALVARLAAEPGGVVLATARHDGSPMGALVTVSMEEPGHWRVTFFDEDGFSGHLIRNSKVEALQQAVSEGYRDTDRDLLRRLRKTDRFHRTLWRV